MTKGKLRKVLLITIAAACLAFAGISVSAESYTYSVAGKYQYSPDAYQAARAYDSFGEAGTLNHPSDITVAPDGRIVITDKGNNRIVILNERLECTAVLREFQNAGQTDGFDAPTGCFVDKDGNLYVADTMHGRVVVFDRDLHFLRVTAQFSADVLPENFIYQPVAVAVNDAGRMYLVSMNTNMGVMAVSPEGNFEGFIGAQRVSANALELFWRMFMSEEQLERSVSFVPVEYSNLTVDDEGFIYVTSASIDPYDLYTAVNSSASTYAPIKKLNPSGTDVLFRYGFFSPVGDIDFDPYGTDKDFTASAIGEVCLLDHGQYLLVDTEHQRMFVYDDDGNLLYAFGGNGEALGKFTTLSSVAYADGTLYALDESRGEVTTLQRTAYGDLLDEVCALRENRDYAGSTEKWNEIIAFNNNSDLAYFGIGKDLLDQGNYREAMSYFKLIGNRTYYMKAFEKERQAFLNRYGIWIFLLAVLVIIGIVKLFGVAARRNEKNRALPANGKLRSELLYSLYLIFHPFKGFYELKHEQRGSVRSATVLLALAALSFLCNGMMQAYGLQSSASQSSIFVSLASLLLPVALWCVSNWCFTSLMDGKGSMKDIYISTCYSLTPIVLLYIPATLLSHCLTEDEYAILSMVLGFAIFWTALLIFCGNLTVHDYELGKNILVCLLTILGIAIILFLCMVFFNLLGDIVALIQNISAELRFRA